MLRVATNVAFSAAIAAGILFAWSSFPSVGASPALAPASQQIVRNTMLEEVIELPAGVYNLVVAELVVDPGAETVAHVHPGPSVGFIAEGRLTFSLAGQGSTNSYSAGSAFQHPWDTPHVMSNR